MFGKDTMIKMGLAELTKFMKSKGGTMEFTENEINNFIADKGQPFSLVCLDDEKKGKTIKLIYSGD